MSLEEEGIIEKYNNIHRTAAFNGSIFICKEMRASSNKFIYKARSKALRAFFLCAGHGTVLTGESPVTGSYRQV